MRRRQIPARNRSPHGWWTASYLERFVFDDENRRDLSRRCLAWENTILIEAKDREQAYRKAVAHGRLGQGGVAREVGTGRKGRWRFEGLTSLLPIYERLENGAEVLWQEHAGCAVRSVLAKVKRKKQLEVFQDDHTPETRRGRTRG